MNHHFWRRFDGYLLCLGPEATEYGKDYLWCFPVDFDGKFQGVSTRLITKEAHDDAVRAVNAKMGVRVFYERLGDNPCVVVQTSGVNERRIVMQKEKIGSLLTDMKPGAQPDYDAMERETIKAIRMARQGHCAFRNPVQVTNQADLEKAIAALKMEPGDTFIGVIRHDN